MQRPPAPIPSSAVSLVSLVLTPLRPGAFLVRPATAVAHPVGAAISVRLPLGVVSQMLRTSAPSPPPPRS